MPRPRRLRQPLPAAAGEASLAAQLFGRRPEHKLALLKAAWSSAVGAELARRTEVLAIEGRTLRVRVPDAHWRKVLHRLRRDILVKLQVMVGPLAPAVIGFQEGAVVVPAAESEPRPSTSPAATEAPFEVQKAASAIADREIRERFTAAAARYLQGKDGPQ